MLVDDPRIEKANSWILSSQTAMSTLLGAPIGGALYALGRAVPLTVDAVSFGLSAILVAAIAGNFHPRTAEDAPTTIRPTSPTACAGCSPTGCCGRWPCCSAC